MGCGHGRRVKVALRLLHDEQTVQELDLVIRVEQALVDHALVAHARDAPQHATGPRDQYRGHRLATIARRAPDLQRLPLNTERSGNDRICRMPEHFIRDEVVKDLESRRYTQVVTRFPPEPNGYLHIGHAKAICLDFGMAKEFNGHCNLRFDDTNPTKESQEYVDAIMRDIHWLGFDWGQHLHHASDYFEQLYQWAVQLIKAGKAYVDELTHEQMREARGTLTEAGTESPYRNRPVAESLDLLERMRRGEFEG